MDWQGEVNMSFCGAGAKSLELMFTEVWCFAIAVSTVLDFALVSLRTSKILTIETKNK